MSGWAVYFNEALRYAAASALQDRLVEARHHGTIPDTVLLLEHFPTVTLGARGRTASLLHDAADLAREGIDLESSTRGGDVTYHAPGQQIIYPIIKLGEREADTHGYLRNLEEIAIRTLSDFGIPAMRRAGLTGAWTEKGKIAAIGIRFRHWITLHGMSLNVDPDMRGFDLIVPCGLQEEKVTTMRELLGDKCPSMEEVRERVLHHFTEVCHRSMDVFTSREEWPEGFSELVDL